MTAAVSGAFLSRSRRQSSPYVVAIVGDRRLSVAALTALLLQDTRYQLIDEERGVENVRTALRSYRPAAAVVETAGAAWDAFPPRPERVGRTLLLLDPEDEPDAFVRAIRVRPDGYLSRTASRDDFEAALEDILETGYHLDPLLAARILRALQAVPERLIAQRHNLSSRERDILVAVASGRSTKEIGRAYAMAPKTVGNHVTNIRQKLNLRHRGELVIYAAREGLASLQPTAPVRA